MIITMRDTCWILLVFLYSFALRAQKIEDYSLKHTLKQDGLSMQFTVLDSDKKGIHRHRTSKIYYWYKAQRVIGTQGGSSGQLLHGLFESFYSNKQLCEKGKYLKGLKHGSWFYWRHDGTLRRTENWTNGVLKGEQADYDDKGKLQKQTIIRGKSCTIQSGDTLIEINRCNKQITLNDSTGKVCSVSRYRKGLLHGKQEVFVNDTTVELIRYKQGIEQNETPKKERSKKPFSHFFRKKEAVQTSEPASENKKKKKRTSDAQTTPTEGEQPPANNRKKGWFKPKNK